MDSPISDISPNQWYKNKPKLKVLNNVLLPNRWGALKFL